VAQCAKREGLWYGGLWAADWLTSFNSDHKTPEPSCTCGVYGALDLDVLCSQYPDLARDLVAVIAAEGITIVGDKGLRTEAARVVAYWSPNWYIRKICARQCGSARRFTDLDAMLAAYHFPEDTSSLPYRSTRRSRRLWRAAFWLAFGWDILWGIRGFAAHQNMTGVVMMICALVLVMAVRR
jgi:hypothetical protein